MKNAFVHSVGWGYRHVAAPVFFLWDSEPIHDFFLVLGEVMGKVPGAALVTQACLRVSHPSLATTIAGIHFENPIGLAAGFDHEAQLPEMVGSIGFGFESVGTITNGSYGGNPYPRIKRLVRSRAILVNKGFKSTGMVNVLARLKARGARWAVPIGISIGKTNSAVIETHEAAIADVRAAFQLAKDSGLPFSYYELNISCPNLLKDISFYEPERLAQMLEMLTALSLDKPLFIKMPIGLTDEKTIALVDVVLRYPVAALIFGNLQHDRAHPTFDVKEIAEYAGIKGNWSGLPCQSRSDELVKLVFRRVGGKIAIVGCGGIFTAEDAYRKIRNGASLVQLVAATIFEGPQIAAEICADLPKLLARDGFAHVKDAVGVDAAA